jgi:hypothetical protein
MSLAFVGLSHRAHLMPSFSRFLGDFASYQENLMQHPKRHTMLPPSGTRFFQTDEFCWMAEYPHSHAEALARWFDEQARVIRAYSTYESPLPAAPPVPREFAAPVTQRQGRGISPDILAKLGLVDSIPAQESPPASTNLVEPVPAIVYDGPVEKV